MHIKEYNFFCSFSSLQFVCSRLFVRFLLCFSILTISACGGGGESEGLELRSDDDTHSASSLVVSDEGETLLVETFNLLDRLWEIEHIRLTNQLGGYAYASYISSGENDAPTVVITKPYAGINWTGEEVDERWAARYLGTSQAPVCHPDEDGPGFVSGESSDICYQLENAQSLGDQAYFYLSNNFNVLFTFGRFYAGGSFENDVEDVVAGLRYLTTRADIDHNRVGIIGASWGGFQALHAAWRAPELLNLAATVATAPVADVPGMIEFVISKLPTLVSDDAYREYEIFYDPYLRRMGAYDETINYSGYRASDVNAGINSPMLIPHDDGDTISPAHFSHDLAKSSELVEGFWYTRMDDAPWETERLSHGELFNGMVLAPLHTFTTAYLVSSLGGEQVSTVPYGYQDMHTFFSNIKQYQSEERDVSWLVPRLVEMSSEQLHYVDLTSDSEISSFSGPFFVSYWLNTIWETDIYNETNVKQLLLESGLPQSRDTLKQLAAEHGLLIGSQIDPQYLISIPETIPTFEEEYETFFLDEFQLMVPGNNFKLRHIQPEQGSYTFDVTDIILDYAEQHDLTVHGHTLVWGNPKSLPAWLKEGTWSREALIDVLVDHVSTVVTHNRGRVAAWDVVNEAFCKSANYPNGGCAVEHGELGGLDESLWYEVIGPEFIEIALQTAHAADPDAELYINETGAEFIGTPKADKYYDFVSDLVERNVPLDAVGFQMHTAVDVFDYMPASIVKSRIAANFARFNELGLDVHITELDVRIADSESGPTDEELGQQAQMFSIMLEACLEAQSCSTFNMWGFTDKYSWIPKGHPGYGHATITDSNYQRKPAFEALITTLRGHSHEDHPPESSTLLQEFIVEGVIYNVYDNGAVYAYDVGDSEWIYISHLFDAEAYAAAYQTSDGVTSIIVDGEAYPTFQDKYEDFEDATTFRDLLGLAPQWTSINLISPTTRTPEESNELRDCLIAQTCDFRDNRIDLVKDNFVSGETSLRFSAVSPTSDMVTSKSSMQSSLTHFENGEDLWFSGWFFVEQGMPYSIVDFENDHFLESPGPRVVIQDGKLAVELKFADKPVYQQFVDSEVDFPSNRWVNVKVHLVLSDTGAGKIEVWQDNIKVIDSFGRTSPTYNSVISKWEVGITATDQETVMYVDDVVLSKQEISSFSWFHRWSEQFYDGQGVWGVNSFGYRMALRDSYWRADVYGVTNHSQRELEVISYLIQSQVTAGTGVFPFPADENNPEFGSIVARVKSDCPECITDGWLFTLPGQLMEELYYDHGYALASVARYYLRSGNVDVLSSINAAADWILDKPISNNINYNSALIKGLSYAYHATGHERYRDHAKLLHQHGVYPGFLEGGVVQPVANDDHNAQLEYHGFIVSGMIALVSILDASDDFYDPVLAHLNLMLAYMGQQNLQEEGAYGETWPGTNLIAWYELSQLRPLTVSEQEAVVRIALLIDSYIDDIANEANSFVYQKALYSYFILGIVDG